MLLLHILGLKRIAIGSLAGVVIYAPTFTTTVVVVVVMGSLLVLFQGVACTRVMFFLGENAGRGRGDRLAVGEVPLSTDSRVIKKLIRDADAPFVIRKWQPETITLERFSAEACTTKVLVHSYESRGVVEEEIELGELVDRIATGSTVNAKSVHEVFDEEQGRALLRACVDTDRIDELRGTEGAEWGELAALLFIGNRKTFTRCHADPSVNLYLQLQGRKKWHLWPPSAAPELYVLPRANVAYMSVVNDHDRERSASRFPAYDRADRAVITIEPGDLLYVPPWWFHEVQNEADTPGEPVVGLSMNWLSVSLGWRLDKLLSLGTLMAPRFLWRYWSPDSAPVDDEIMRSCRRLKHGPAHPLRNEKTDSPQRSHFRSNKTFFFGRLIAWWALMKRLFGSHFVEALASTPRRAPVSVNYFISRRCNMGCKFCFHTAKTSQMLSLEDAKRGLSLLEAAGMEKLNIAGGEPFLEPTFLGELLRFASTELAVSTAIISNGSLISKHWMREYGKFVDILGISCDSFDPDINARLGRAAPGLAGIEHLEQIFRVRDWVSQQDIKFKLNTVVTSLNHEEDMNAPVTRLDPFRWKVFQCLVLDGENGGIGGDLRDARPLVVSPDQFAAFVDRHSAQASLVPETNNEMQASYLLLDEKMRWLDCSDGSKMPREISILDDPAEVFEQAGFDYDMFVKRGGIYTW
ncbi:hypothetical protein CTAYLR_002863 [Chrysophaeum taylorii]|uniref:JmjC domain-containing protein n=1 Tax=Chrysophaeum taylorii TaxID=2483200 RepID=A0AAD7XHX0_9STRA|nr:hypothetical protein CTAYLR_002863 [Chrysophaeum taylorii]